MNTATPTITCPSWCARNHPTGDPDTHQSTTWRKDGFAVLMELPPGDSLPTISVDHGPHEMLDVTPAEARTLAAKLVELADRAEGRA